MWNSNRRSLIPLLKYEKIELKIIKYDRYDNKIRIN